MSLHRPAAVVAAAAILTTGAVVGVQAVTTTTQPIKLCAKNIGRTVSYPLANGSCPSGTTAFHVARASDVQALATRVDSAEGTISAQGGKITALEGAVAAQSARINDLETLPAGDAYSTNNFTGPRLAPQDWTVIGTRTVPAGTYFAVFTGTIYNQADIATQIHCYIESPGGGPIGTSIDDVPAHEVSTIATQGLVRLASGGDVTAKCLQTEPEGHVNVVPSLTLVSVDSITGDHVND